MVTGSGSVVVGSAVGSWVAVCGSFCGGVGSGQGSRCQAVRGHAVGSVVGAVAVGRAGVDGCRTGQSSSWVCVGVV